jgi:pSer/pThr/pTyr-binding forkhead associated (FHA) protein
MAAAGAEKPVEPVPSGASIEVMRGFYEGLELPIDRDWFVIGRGRGADAILADATISRAHAAIGYESNLGFFVQDLGSTNGTLLNGERKQRGALNDGDTIQIGKLALRVSLPKSGGAR